MMAHPQAIAKRFRSKGPQKDAEGSRLPGSILRLEEYSMKFKKGRLILPNLIRPDQLISIGYSMKVG